MRVGSVSPTTGCMMRQLLLALTLLVTGQASAQADWRPFRWQGHNGPRDIEFDRVSIARKDSIVSVKIRRDRATTLRQDPTIAPETHPWTGMLLELDCVHRRWRPTRTVAVNSSGRETGMGTSSRWIAIEPLTLAEAMRERLCPTA